MVTDRKKYMAVWLKKNPDYQKNYSAEWRKKNPDYFKKWAIENRDYRNEWRRKDYKKRRMVFLANQKQSGGTKKPLEKV